MIMAGLYSTSVAISDLTVDTGRLSVTEWRPNPKRTRINVEVA